MADPKKTFPMVTVQRWWTLRNRFRSSLPPKVTPAYLHSVLGISEKTARDVELPMLKRVGLIESDGSTGDLARRWRDDGQYPAVCTEIRNSIYPEELLHAVPDPATDEQAAIRWFMNATGGGEKAAGNMARTYRLLSEADPVAAAVSNDRQRPANSSRSKGEQPAKQVRNRRETKVGAPMPEATEHPGKKLPAAPERLGRMALHIDVQIHIAADASAPQIDQIFASMAKHLYNSDES